MITLWLSQAVIAYIGEAMYIIALLASLAIALRMWGIWRKWHVEMAANLVCLSLLAAVYWLYVIIRIHMGCSNGETNDLACLDLTFWARILVAAGTSFIAAWVWLTH